MVNYQMLKLKKLLDLEIRHRSFVDEGIIRLLDALPDRAHPMATMELQLWHFQHTIKTTYT